MPSYVEWRGSEALLRRIHEIQAATRPGSRVRSRILGDFQKIIVEDHTDKLMRSVDRYGRPLAPLRGGRALTAAETRARRGTGGPLVPRGTASRAITNFEAVWVTRGGQDELVGRFRDVLSKDGKPFMQYHLTGANLKRKGRVIGTLPRRDIGGITPKGWRRLIDRHRQMPEDIRRSGGGRTT